MRYSLLFLLAALPARLDGQAAVANADSQVVAPDALAEQLLVDVQARDSTIRVDARYAGPDNFTGAPLPPGAFTFDLPAGWVAVPVSGNHDTLLAGIRGQNPALAESLAARLGGLSDTTTYVAFDASSDAVQKGDLVMLVVTEVALPADVALQTFATTIKGQVEKLVEGTVDLRQILINLLSNAAKFTEHGQITLAAGRERDGDVDRVTFRVSDTGIGMTVEQIEQKMKEHGILVHSTGPRRFRLVTHYWIDDSAVEKTVEAFKAELK